MCACANMARGSDTACGSRARCSGGVIGEGIRGGACAIRSAALRDALRLQKLRELLVETENVVVDPDLNETR